MFRPFICMFLVLRVRFLWRYIGRRTVAGGGRGGGGDGGRNDSLAARSCSRSRSCLAFRAAAPARPAATFLGPLTFFCLGFGSVTLSTGLCAGSSACVYVSWFSCFVSAIAYSNRALISKLAVLHGRQYSCQR